MAKKRGKKYQDALKKVDSKKEYAVKDAVQLVKDIAYANFDSTIEVAFNLNVDTKQADQQLRGAVVLPNGTGKDQTVIVFANGENAKAAQEAGADFVGDDDLVEKIQDGWLDFDVAIATPDMMPKVGRLGRVLGPKGLMPNPIPACHQYHPHRRFYRPLRSIVTCPDPCPAGRNVPVPF